LARILEVEQALAQIGVADLIHARAVVVLDLLHRRLGGEPAAHRLADAGEPAAIGGKHAIGFEDIAVLAAIGDIARRQKIVDRRLHLAHRLA